ncbi:MAG: ATP synthase subunit I [Gammaproteobacteria bacterium]|nr:ATP synthase subunit I [Gammaproteobacteria bacterium]
MERIRAYQQLWLQLILSVVFAAIGLLLHGVVTGYSALLGGLVVILPSYLFLLFAFRFSGARAAGKMLGAFYLGELVKLVTMAALIVLVLKYLPIHGLAFMVSFIGVQFFALLIGFWQSNNVAVGV